MSCKKVWFEFEIKVFYDAESTAFKNALASYRNAISPDGDEENMLEHICFHISRNNNYQDLVEGVGYVRYKGQCAKPEMWCGVEIDTYKPEYYVNIQDSRLNSEDMYYLTNYPHTS